jgi:hypothetical protein
MAMQDKQGNWHHSAGRAALQDDMDAQKSAKPAGEKAAPMSKKGGASTEGKTDVSHMDIGEVVEKHGPAHAIHMTHPMEGTEGPHTVTSHHGKEGHMHHSEHDTMEEAHDHAAQAAGMNNKGEQEEEDAQNTPGQEADEEMEPVASGKGIPGMASA